MKKQFTEGMIKEAGQFLNDIIEGKFKSEDVKHFEEVWMTTLKNLGWRPPQPGCAMCSDTGEVYATKNKQLYVFRCMCNLGKSWGDITEQAREKGARPVPYWSKEREREYEPEYLKNQVVSRYESTAPWYQET